MIGLRVQEKQARYRVKGGKRRPAPAALIEVGEGSIPFAAIASLTRRLGVEPGDLLATIGISSRTAARRKTQGALSTEEADRLLRVARVLEEAIRVFGDAEKAAAWLRTAHPMLGGAAPYRLLDSDAGAKSVSDELIRIDCGDFA
jgi:putative toxin-antitoxin system antitoxin component (TIGR02293 family)